MSYYRQLIQTELPSSSIGSVFFAMGTSVPTGTLLCDGSAISRTTYSALYAVIGTAYGVGDGSTTFNLPNYAGQFLRFYDHGNGADPDSASRTDRGDGTTGNYVGTKQADTNLAHTHTEWSGAAANNWGMVYGTTAGTYNGGVNLLPDGGAEFRPININMMAVIGY